MKLNHRPELKLRTPAREALAVDTAEPKSEFFDPRVDFPARELARLRELAAQKDHQRSRLLEDPLNNGWWLSLVDPELKQLLTTHPNLKDQLKLEFDAEWRNRGNTGRRQAYILSWAGSIIQLYPSLRDEIRQDYGDHVLPRILSKEQAGPFTFSHTMAELVGLLQLYPERRAEWLEMYGIQSDQVLQQMTEAFKWPDNLKDEVWLIADLLLVFPQLRPDILTRVKDRKGADQLTKELKSEQRPFERNNFQVAFFLTIIGAEDARIDEKGQIQLQLKPLPLKTGARPLPERPLD